MKTIRKTILMPPELVKEIEKYMEEKYIATFTGAVIELLRKALKSKE